MLEAWRASWLPGIGRDEKERLNKRVQQEGSFFEIIECFRTGNRKSD
jgi:hypothetical protein